MNRCLLTGSGRVYACRKCRPYIQGAHFYLETDHRNLMWLSKVGNDTQQLYRWSLELSTLDFTLRHCVNGPGAYSTHIWQGGVAQQVQNHTLTWPRRPVTQHHHKNNPNPAQPSKIPDMVTCVVGSSPGGRVVVAVLAKSLNLDRGSIEID